MTKRKNSIFPSARRGGKRRMQTKCRRKRELNPLLRGTKIKLKSRRRRLPIGKISLVFPTGAPGSTTGGETSVIGTAVSDNREECAIDATPGGLSTPHRTVHNVATERAGLRRSWATNRLRPKTPETQRSPRSWSYGKIAAKSMTSRAPADARTSREESESTRNEVQATIMARHAQSRRVLASAGRARHPPEQAGAPVRTLTRVHVAAAEREAKPLGADAQGNPAGAGRERLRRTVHHSATRRSAPAWTESERAPIRERAAYTWLWRKDAVVTSLPRALPSGHGPRAASDSAAVLPIVSPPTVESAPTPGPFGYDEYTPRHLAQFVVVARLDVRV